MGWVYCGMGMRCIAAVAWLGVLWHGNEVHVLQLGMGWVYCGMGMRCIAVGHGLGVLWHGNEVYCSWAWAGCIVAWE